MYNSIHYKFHNLYLTKYISYVLITNMKVKKHNFNSSCIFEIDYSECKDD